jgi:Heterokaryon incompatibility protein (HET)
MSIPTLSNEILHLALEDSNTKYNSSTDKAEHNQEHLDIFKYTALPCKRCIRLLKLQPLSENYDLEADKASFWDGREPIRCSMEIVCLDDKPEYDALSYTWKNPVTVYENKENAEQEANRFTQERTVICDGKVMMVGVNLHDALLVVRLTVSIEAYETIISRRRSGLIWIDALCINQKNDEERAAQVAIMGQIYSKAQTTIIWLGRDDQYTRPAASVIQHLSRIRLEQTRLMRRETRLLEFRNYEALGIPQISNWQWTCLYAFFQRSWFRRAWIVQVKPYPPKFMMIRD